MPNSSFWVSLLALGHTGVGFHKLPKGAAINSAALAKANPDKAAMLSLLTGGGGGGGGGDGGNNGGSGSGSGGGGGGGGAGSSSSSNEHPQEGKIVGSRICVGGEWFDVNAYMDELGNKGEANGRAFKALDSRCVHHSSNNKYKN